jgi:hypothetical protein
MSLLVVLLGLGGFGMKLAKKRVKRASKLFDKLQNGLLVHDSELAFNKANLILRTPHRP